MVKTRSPLWHPGEARGFVSQRSGATRFSRLAPAGRFLYGTLFSELTHAYLCVTFVVDNKGEVVNDGDEEINDSFQKI